MIRIRINESVTAARRAEAVIVELAAAAGLPLTEEDPRVELVYGGGPVPSGAGKAYILIPEACGPSSEILYLEQGGARVPVPFVVKEPAGKTVVQAENGRVLISFRDGRVSFGFDLVRAADYFLGGSAERHGNRDIHGRLGYDGAPAWYDEAVAVVTRYAYLLAEAYGLACGSAGVPPLRAARWQGGAPYAVAISHDIDQLHSYSRADRLKAVVGSIARGKRPATLNFLSPKRHYDSLTNIFKTEGKYGAVSTFFVGALRRGPLDFNYDLEEARALLDGLSGRAEVGLHASYYLKNAGQLTEEAEALRKAAPRAKVTGVRGHYLRPDPEVIWRWAEEAGLEYDASLGYANRLGFRRGHCLPFLVPDTSRQTSDLYEVPLTVMDGTLFQAKRLTIGRAREAAFGLLNEAASVGGLFSVLWHYRAFPGGQYPEWAEVFEGLLARAAADGACFLTHAEAVRRRKGWGRFGAVANKKDGTVEVVLSGAAGTIVPVPVGWTAGDKDDRTLTIPASGELRVAFKRK